MATEPLSPPRQIADLFEFLKRNKKYNRKIQESEIRRILVSYDTIEDRARYLLHEIINTQSRPSLDHVAVFFEQLSGQPGALTTFNSFLRYLDPASKYKGDLFKALKNPGTGWGDKTSALFVRNLALIRKDAGLGALFWHDLDLLDAQSIRLPVDAVISAIFERLAVSEHNSLREVKGFDGINKYLAAMYSREDMLIWDDLWFWGFITQRSDSKITQRIFDWNEAKYWSIFTAPKGKLEIDTIKQLSREFRRLLGCSEQECSA